MNKTVNNQYDPSCDFLILLNNCNNIEDLYNKLIHLLAHYENRPYPKHNLIENTIIDDNLLFYTRLRIIQSWSRYI